jgi:hypothetical protein
MSGNGGKSGSAAAAAAPKEEPKLDEFQQLFAGDKAFERVDIPEVEGWFKAVPGAYFFGRILSHFQIEDRKNGNMRDILVIRLGADCKNASLVGTKVDGTIAKNGILAVGLTHKLKPLLEYVANKGIVAARATVKKSIGNGQTMWEYEIQCKGVKAAPPVTSQLTAAEAEAATKTKFDDIPF